MALNFSVWAAASRLLAAWRTSMAFGSSEGVASGAGLASTAAALTFFFAVAGFACALGATKTTPSAITSSTDQRYLFGIIMSSPRLTEIRVRASWNHSAFEHFVGDGRGYLVDKGRTHLRVGFQHLESFLFHLRWGSLAFLGSLLPQLLTGRLLILLNDLLRNPVQ